MAGAKHKDDPVVSHRESNNVSNGLRLPGRVALPTAGDTPRQKLKEVNQYNLLYLIDWSYILEGFRIIYERDVGSDKMIKTISLINVRMTEEGLEAYTGNLVCDKIHHEVRAIFLKTKTPRATLFNELKKVIEERVNSFIMSTYIEKRYVEKKETSTRHQLPSTLPSMPAHGDFKIISLIEKLNNLHAGS